MKIAFLLCIRVTYSSIIHPWAEAFEEPAKNTELSQWESLLQYAKDSVRAHLKSCREQVRLAAPSPLEKHFLRWWEIKPCLKSTTFQIPAVVKSKYPVWILLQTSWSRYPRALSRESKAQSGAVWLHINVSKTVDRLDAIQFSTIHWKSVNFEARQHVLLTAP